jgi:hypothetical protein
MDVMTMNDLQSKAIAEFEYDALVGKVIRRRGCHLGWNNGQGYLMHSFNGHNVVAHRLAWLIHYGNFPDCNLDHINGDPSDNRIANLRLANYQQNNANRRGWGKSLSGVKGVSMKNGRWFAQIMVNRKNMHLGYFDTIEAAASAYAAAANKYFGEFAKVA